MKSLQEFKNNIFKKTSLKKILKITAETAIVFTFLFLGFLVFISLQSKVTGKTPSVGGYQFYSVLGVSMEPNIHKGSIIVVKRPKLENLKKKDVVTFISPSDKTTIVTHRIVEVNNKKDLSFITRGDANDGNDNTPVPANYILGKVKLSVPLIGYALNFSRTKAGLLFLIIIPGLFIIFYEAIKLKEYFNQVKAREREKMVAEMTQKIMGGEKWINN